MAKAFDRVTLILAWVGAVCSTVFTVLLVLAVEHGFLVAGFSMLTLAFLHNAGRTTWVARHRRQ